jgi:hypothetical protein
MHLLIVNYLHITVVSQIVQNMTKLNLKYVIALRIAEVVDILVFRQLIGQGLHLQLTVSHLQGQGQEFVTVGIVDGGEEEEVKDVLPTPVQILDLHVQCVQGKLNA